MTPETTISIVSHFKIISVIGHNVLHDPTRNSEHGIDDFCDNLFIIRSTYWRKPGWYKTMGGARYLMPEKAIVSFHCGAY